MDKELVEITAKLLGYTVESSNKRNLQYDIECYLLICPLGKVIEIGNSNSLVDFSYLLEHMQLYYGVDRRDDLWQGKPIES